MHKTLSYLFHKLLQRQKFVNYWAILISDTLLSALATFITLLFFGNFIEYVSNRDYAIFMIISLMVSAFCFHLLKIERKIIRHSTLRSMWRVFQAVLLKEFAIIAICIAISNQLSLTHLYGVTFLDFIITCMMLLTFRLTLIVVYDLAVSRFIDRKTRILIYDTGNASVSLCKQLYTSHRYDVVGFICLDNDFKKCEVNDKHVYYFKDEATFANFVIHKNIKGIIFPSHKDAQAEAERLMAYAERLEIKTLVTPPIDEFNAASRTQVREIKIEDLLGRDEINIDMQAVTNHFKDKVVMVTGAAGSIGSELCRQLATFGVKKLVLFDNAETPTHEFRLELERTHPELDFVPYLGDVRQIERLRMAFERYKPQIVFHAAAYKHVPLMEENPCEAVRVNVVGSRQVADFCLEYGVEEMVMISTDKAVNPTNVMGASKRMAEIYVQSLGLAVERGEVKGYTRFITTRFGNVLGSNGSVIPHFRKQIERGGPVTVTHPDITRFFMTIPEACRLVMEAATMSTGNQIFVFDMGESVKIVHLAERMIRLAGFIPYEEIPITFTGLRPGEKLYEEVLSDAENTLPTEHKKIHKAKVREYNREDILDYYERIHSYALFVRIEECVKIMKQLMPDFVSKNSVYEKFDVKVGKKD